MNSVIETLFLRRPRIEYSAPPVCDADFSSSGTPTIILDPIERNLGPTGPVAGGRGLRFFTWPRYRDVICFTIYRANNSDQPLGPYSIVSECISPDVIALCSAGDYYITVTTESGESAPGPTTTVPGTVYTFLALPQAPGTICYNLYRNGVKVWECFAGGAFQVCEDGCYRVSAITPDGESPLSDPTCVEGCSGVTCPDGYVVDEANCDCVVCPEQECPPGQQWDPDTCACVETPVGPCTPYIDALSATQTVKDVKRLGVACGYGSGNVAFLYKERVITTFSIDDGVGGNVAPNFVDADGDVYGSNYGDPPYFNWRRAVNGSFETIGNDTDNEMPGISLNGTTIYRESPATTARVWKKGSGVLYSNTGDCGVNFGSACSPDGMMNFGVFDFSGNVTLHLWTEAGGHVDTGYVCKGLDFLRANSAGHCGFGARTGAVPKYDVAYYDGSSVTVVHVSTFGVNIGGINSSNVIVGVEDVAGPPYNGAGSVFTWDPINGYASLPFPSGATIAFKAYICDDNIIVALFDNGVHFYYAGNWYLMSSLAPYNVGWSAFDDVINMTNDGYFAGGGTFGGGSRNYVAKVCPEVFV